MKIALFSYAFPHRKSQEFLVRLCAEGFEVSSVLAAPYVELKNRPEAPRLRTKPRRAGLVDPAALARRLGVPFNVVPHNSDEAIHLLRSSGADIGIVAGARILQSRVITALEHGVLNFHPGLIPEARGLDALKWSILRGIPPGITVHFIDERVDAGWIVRREVVPVHSDDTLVDLGLRLEETQSDLLPQVLNHLRDRSIRPTLVVDAGTYDGVMPPDLELQVERVFEQWRASMSDTS